MKAWLCRRGWHGWDTWIWWTGRRFIVRKECSRPDCHAVSASK